MTRAEHRLSIARGLLGLTPDADIMEAIDCLPPAQREQLRGHVDWVEDYDLEDALA
jgi:hypothetical protein